MTIPAEIRSVVRPENTEIFDSGSNSPKRFCVRSILTPAERLEHPTTKYGKVVGHIFNNKFFPKEDTKVTQIQPPMVSYGASALALSACQPMALTKNNLRNFKILLYDLSYHLLYSIQNQT